jgi:hypothetical protein
MSIDRELDPIELFIRRWSDSAGAERANYGLFLSELCDVLGVERPNPTQAHESDNSYVFEKAVTSAQGTTRFIDLYKRNCFVLEAKQGSEKEEKPELASAASLQEYARRKKGTAVRGTPNWDTAMLKAKNQAEAYIRLLTGEEIREGRPPFLLVVDVGNSIELYAEFTRTGGAYVPFPDPASYRLTLADLREPAVREVLAQIWTHPQSLDPTRKSAKVTRLIAEKLGALAKQLEADGYEADQVASFLMRCLFTMFAEDVGLLPERSFAQLLDDLGQDPTAFKPMVEGLWQTMNTGGFSMILRQPLPRFNGGLFADSFALPLHKGQIALLAEAARADWRDVEPAIFGTLLERALNPVERHKLGAHYTPRAYVERLVRPTVLDPLRAEWEAVQAAALFLAETGEKGKAIGEVEGFLHKLTSLRVLDPACGSGNFLYVTLELLKRLEGEVLNTLRALGDERLRLELQSITVSPQQFLGIEVNPRAAAIAELVLWIGYLQWHFKTQGKTNPPEPIIKNYHNIECRDAVLAWEGVEPLRDKAGQVVTRWDGRTTKPHPVTGEAVPDETARVEAVRYLKPRKAAWPQADFIIGNPPFIGTARMREALGDGYTEALRSVYANVPDSADLVMFWWDKAAEATRTGKTRRFGLITTNSLRQTFNRRVVQHHLGEKQPLSLLFAIPDHPWVDSADGAAVRIAMTVGGAGEARDGVLQTVIQETETGTDEIHVQLSNQRGVIFADLTVGVNVAGALSLQANADLSNRGVSLFGLGFIVTPEEAELLGLSRIPNIEKHIRHYRHGRDLTDKPRGVMVIDLFGLNEQEVQTEFPELYQWVYQRVKPEREQNNRKSRRENWWLFGETNPKLRQMLKGLNRYIATVETSKHRFFVFLDDTVLPDNKLVNIALEDAYYLGVLSSHIHVTWALRAGSILGPTPVYVKTTCFEAFPFPVATEAQKETIRQLAEQLDAHRKRQQTQHPSLTMTGMYNVLEKLRTGEPLDEKERAIHEMGLLTILHQLHADLDRAVAEAYGWPATLSDEEILARLVSLNQARAEEEENGLIRYLRPAYQNPEAVGQTQLLDIAPVAGVAGGVGETRPWPKKLSEQILAVQQVLQGAKRPLTVQEVAQSFAGRLTKPRREAVGELLQVLVRLGQAELVGGGGYTAV